jgi:hypothetical protein
MYLNRLYLPLPAVRPGRAVTYVWALLLLVNSGVQLLSLNPGKGLGCYRSLSSRCIQYMIIPIGFRLCNGFNGYRRFHCCYLFVK